MELRGVDLGFPPFDPMDIEIHYEDAWREGHPREQFNRLELRLIDGEGRRRRVEFFDVEEYTWRVFTEDIPGERDDCFYEVIHSLRIAALVARDDIRSEEGYRHLRLNFNPYRTLEMICKSWTVHLEDERNRKPTDPLPGSSNAFRLLPE